MEEYLSRLSAELGQWPPALVYGALILSAFLENIVPPVPGDTVVVFSAYLVGRGVLGLWAAYLATCAGGMLGFMAMFFLGYTRGRMFFVSRGGRLFTEDNLAKAEGWLARYGLALVAANRFLSGVRSVIALAAGMGRMDWKRVALAGLLSIALWNALMFYAGMMVGQHWGRVLEYLEEYNRILTALLVAGALGLAWRWWRRRSRS
ncbi:MAG: DedA family protein [Candidatus Latescibacteria bacterium]|nr:DedA family protein [Candidatus Latescibacterota bacterium]